MRIILAFVLAAGIGATGVAFAANDVTNTVERQSQATTIDAIKTRMEAMGYDVRYATRAEDSYRLRLVERQSRGEVNATFDDGSGELVAAELAGKNKDARGHERTERESDARGHQEREHDRAERHGASHGRDAD